MPTRRWDAGRFEIQQLSVASWRLELSMVEVRTVLTSWLTNSKRSIFIYYWTWFDCFASDWFCVWTKPTTYWARHGHDSRYVIMIMKHTISISITGNIIQNRTFRKYRNRKEKIVGLVAMYDPRTCGWLRENTYSKSQCTWTNLPSGFEVTCEWKAETR